MPEPKPRWKVVFRRLGLDFFALNLGRKCGELIPVEVVKFTSVWDLKPGAGPGVESRKSCSCGPGALGQGLRCDERCKGVRGFAPYVLMDKCSEAGWGGSRLCPLRMLSHGLCLGFHPRHFLDPGLYVFPSAVGAQVKDGVHSPPGKYTSSLCVSYRKPLGNPCVVPTWTSIPR